MGQSMPIHVVRNETVREGIKTGPTGLTLTCTGAEPRNQLPAVFKSEFTAIPALQSQISRWSMRSTLTLTGIKRKKNKVALVLNY
jgi:hypothetical protein